MVLIKLAICCTLLQVLLAQGYYPGRPQKWYQYIARRGCPTTFFGGTTSGPDDTQVWRRTRTNEFSYSPPSATPGEERTVVTLRVQGRKSRIFAMSDLHIGRFDEALNTTLTTYFNSILRIARTEVLAVALLGDILEGWLDPIADQPPQPLDMVERFQTSSGYVLTRAIKQLTREKGVKVFFIRGNHDHELTAEVISALFGPEVEFVKGQLVIKLDQGRRVPEYRLAMSHGHEWEIFNTYSLTATEQVVGGFPHGYYLGRASRTGSNEDLTQCGSKQEEIDTLNIGKALRLLPDSVRGIIIQLLAAPQINPIINAQLYFSVLGLPPTTDPTTISVVLPSGTRVNLGTLLQDNFLQNLITQFDIPTIYNMVQAFFDDYERFARDREEDVVLFGHTHVPRLETLENRRGNRIIHGNTGAWNRCTRTFSAIMMKPPTRYNNGFVQLQTGDNRVGILSPP